MGAETGVHWPGSLVGPQSPLTRQSSGIINPQVQKRGPVSKIRRKVIDEETQLDLLTYVHTCKGIYSNTHADTYMQHTYTPTTTKRKMESYAYIKQ